MKKKDNNKYEYLINKSLIRYPRQVRPNSYYFNGCIFIRHKKLINKNNFNNNCLGKSFYGFEITRNESCNIDTIEDLNYCKKNLMQKKFINNFYHHFKNIFFSRKIKISII